MGVFNGNVVKFSLLGVGWVCGWEDRALQECNLSAQPSLECGWIRSRRLPGGGAGRWLKRDASAIQGLKR
jgi:hypothetical protein